MPLRGFCTSLPHLIVTLIPWGKKTETPYQTPSSNLKRILIIPKTGNLLHEHYHSELPWNNDVQLKTKVLNYLQQQP